MDKVPGSTTQLGHEELVYFAPNCLRATVWFFLALTVPEVRGLRTP